MVQVSPATVSVPVRAAPLFAVKLTLTDPGPVRLAGLVKVIHSALEEAVHEQDALVETLMPADPGASPALVAVELSAYTQASC